MLPGDIVILYTDGISEALTEAEEEWGEERLIAAGEEYAALPPGKMIQAVFRAADAFTGPAPQYDDMTMVVLKLAHGAYLPSGDPATISTATMLPATQPQSL